MTYTLFDPTGNITALIDGDSSREEAAGIMQMHPEVEQTGFIREALPEEDGDAMLKMAGGEFCGNASMCAAAWYAEKSGLQSGNVRLDVSGAEDIIMVRIERIGPDSFHAEVGMPPTLGISAEDLEFDGLKGMLPLVRYQGIYHLIIEEDSPFFSFLKEREKAEEAVKEWCEKIDAPGLGLMFVQATEAGCRLTPLVYIPGGDTLFWEHSCASGSSAVCVYIAGKEGCDVSLRLSQPGGVLKVNSDPRGLETWLSGTVKLFLSN